MENTKNEIDIREELLSLEEPPAPITWLLGGDDEKMERIAEHRLQMQSIRKQYPHPSRPYKIGVYIRYFNQTKYENYLEHTVLGVLHQFLPVLIFGIHLHREQAQVHVRYPISYE